MASVLGNTTGLRKKSLHDLERIYRRNIPVNALITPELARFMAELSQELNRQIGLLITREGGISHVILGDTQRIFIPDLSAYPLGRKSLRGLRLIHTHLKNEPLSADDLTDLALLRLDYLAAIGIKNGLPDRMYTAHLMPAGSPHPYELSEDYFHNMEMDFKAAMDALEEQLERKHLLDKGADRERAVLISVSTRARHEQEESLDELEELALSSDIVVVDKVRQRPKDINPRYLMGIGRLKELVIDALGKGATLFVFDQDLTPSQTKQITDLTELKVIDRSQLILDIFARRAHSRDGKVQVELAQLKYTLPRLMGKGTAMSRLMGGIGGRGPGEMKLEIDRRRVRDRINLLEKELDKLSGARKERKRKRVQKGIPIVSIVGYTNAGKSTLLNYLTNSNTFVEHKMFATLDTASRRLRFPREREVIITDTVGFIRDLPKDLAAAFKSTLEELEDADLLLHVVDIANPRFEQHLQSVEAILDELSLEDKPRLIVFNKMDRVPGEEVDNILARYGGVALSAIDRSTFAPLLRTVEERLFIEDTT